MRISLFCTAMVFILGVCCLVAAGSAHVDAELRGGYYTNADNGFLGGGFLTSVGQSWDFNPNVEWVLVDGFDYFTVNGDFHYDLDPTSSTAMWVGAGGAIVVQDWDDRFSRARNDTDVGINLFGGIGAKRGDVRPFGQIKGLLADRSEGSLALGIRF